MRVSEESSGGHKHQGTRLPPGSQSAVVDNRRSDEQPTHHTCQGDDICTASGGSNGGQPTLPTAQTSIRISHGVDTFDVLGRESRGQPSQRADQSPAQSSLQNGSSAALGGESGGQLIQAPIEMLQADATSAVPCSGSRDQVQPAHQVDQSPQEMSLEGGSSTVLCSGSSGQPDQNIDQFHVDKSQSDGTSVALGGGSRDLPTLKSLETTQDASTAYTTNSKIEED